MVDMLSRTTIRPASLWGSFSSVCFAFVTKISLSTGRTLSVKARLPEGRSSMILNTFPSIKDRSARSLVSSRSAGSNFFSMTDFGNEGKTLARPRRNDCFSLGVLAGKDSMKRIVDTRMLSKNSVSWNSFAVRRWAGLLVISRGSTCAIRSLGSGLEDRKLLFTVGIVELDWKNLLYADRLELHSSGDL